MIQIVQKKMDDFYDQAKSTALEKDFLDIYENHSVKRDKLLIVLDIIKKIIEELSKKDYPPFSEPQIILK